MTILNCESLTKIDQFDPISIQSTVEGEAQTLTFNPLVKTHVFHLTKCRAEPLKKPPSWSSEDLWDSQLE